ncbi:major facilitator superfamily domain-containing protein [Lipomyces japonicus]|uniref:major facilitator superfamily domain-containing protein n=1 Tax=Lipomyces japonicus TaxID=56871 RepID=UPI0034CF9FCF
MPHHLDVPLKLRVTQVFFAFLWCLLAAGPIFGFAALKTVWLREGVYKDSCTSDENERGFICSTREIKINFIFTSASVVTNFAGVLVGIILDRFGPRICGYTGGILIFIGAFMLAFADTLILLDLHVWGYMILALGGPFVFISSFQLSNAFPVHSGLILSLLTGAFDASTGVYLIYRLIYDESNGRFHPKAFFLLYLAVPIFIIIGSYTVMPNDSYKPGEQAQKLLEDEEDLDLADAASIVGVDIDTRNGRDTVTRRVKSVKSASRASVVENNIESEQTALLTDVQRDQAHKDLFEYDTQEMIKLRKSGVWGALHGLPALQQIRTPWFALVCGFTLIQMLRLNYFVASIRSQYDFILHSAEKALVVNSFFDIALPVGGIITVPIGGFLLDNFSMTTSWAVLLVMGTAMGILGNLPWITAAYANICIFVIYRSLFYTTASDYVAKVFGFDTFGTVYGLISTISGLFNFVQSGFDHITHRILSRDPRPVNIALLIVSTSVGALFVWYVQRQTKRLKRSALEMEAETATALRMPGYPSSV